MENNNTQQQTNQRQSMMGFSGWNNIQDTSTPVPEPQDTLKLEYPALASQIDNALAQGWDRNKLRKYLAQRESIALTQYSQQEINKFLGRNDETIANFWNAMKAQNDNSYVEIMKYDMSEKKVRDILKTSQLSGIAPGVLFNNPDILSHAEELAGKRENIFGQLSAAVKNMMANYNQSSANAELFDAQSIKNTMNDDNTMRDEGLLIWNTGLKTTLTPPPDDELIEMGRQSYQKRIDTSEQAAKIDTQDAQDWATHVRPPDSVIGATVISAIENFGFSAVSMARSSAGWFVGGPVGGLMMSLYNTMDEAKSEAGEAFIEGLRRGMSPDDAYNRAVQVRNENLLFLPFSNYGQDYMWNKGVELVTRFTEPIFPGNGWGSKIARFAISRGVPLITDNISEGIEEYAQEYFKMDALGDELDQSKLWDAFKMGMADAVIYSLVGSALNRGLRGAKAGAKKIYSFTPKGKAEQRIQNTIQNAFQEIKDVKDFETKIQNGEFKPDDIVANNPVVFLPQSMIDNETAAALDIQNDILEDEDGNVIVSENPQTQEQEQPEENEIAISKEKWDKFAAENPEKAQAFKDVLRDGVKGVTAQEELQHRFNALEKAVNGNPKIREGAQRLHQELLNAGRSEEEAKALTQATAYMANSLVERWGIDAEQAMNLSVKKADGEDTRTEGYNQLMYRGTRFNMQGDASVHRGKGDGRSLFGSGLYLSEAKAVAQHFRRAGIDELERVTFQNEDGETYNYKGKEDISDFLRELASHEIKRSKGDKLPSLHDAAISLIEREREKLNTYKKNLESQKQNGAEKSTISMWRKYVKAQEKKISMLEKSIPSAAEVAPELQGNIYTFEGPENYELLDRDNPIKEQSEKVLKALKKSKLNLSENATGGEFYDALAEKFGGGKKGMDKASAWLNRQGIPGLFYINDYLNYLDEVPEGTHDFVIWGTDLLKFLDVEGDAEAIKSYNQAENIDYPDFIKHGNVKANISQQGATINIDFDGERVTGISRSERLPSGRNASQEERDSVIRQIMNDARAEMELRIHDYFGGFPTPELEQKYGGENGGQKISKTEQDEIFEIANEYAKRILGGPISQEGRELINAVHGWENKQENAREQIQKQSPKTEENNFAKNEYAPEFDEENYSPDFEQNTAALDDIPEQHTPDIATPQPQQPQNINASISWPGGTSSVDTQSLIEFFTSANKSSGFHELAHHVFRVLTDAAQLENASDDLLNDVKMIFENAGVPDEAFYKNIGDARKKAHEYFSKAFETYLAEGVAPDPKLQGFFDNVKAWLIDVYHNVVQKLGINLNDDMRGFFDRLMMSPEMQAEQKRLADIQAAYDTAEISIRQAKKEIERNEALLREREENYAAMNEYSFPQISDDAVNSVNSFMQELDDYASKIDKYNYVRDIVNFIKEQGGISQSDLARYMGKDFAKDMRKKWPGLIGNNKMALDEIAEILVSGGFQDFISQGESSGQGHGDYNTIIKWLSDTDNTRPSKPAPILEVNTDLFNALNQYGFDTAKKYVNERRRYLNTLIEEAQHEHDIIQSAIDKVQGEIQKLERSLKTSQGQENSESLNKKLNDARERLQDINADAAVNDFDLRDMQREQREISKTLNDINNTLKAQENNNAEALPDWLANWNEENLTEEERKALKNEGKQPRKLSRAQTISLAEAMKKGYEMAEKYSRVGFDAGKTAGKQEAKAKAQKRIDYLKGKIDDKEVQRRLQLGSQKALDAMKLKERLAKLKEHYQSMMARQRERKKIRESSQKMLRQIKRMAESKNLIWDKQQDIKNLLETYDLAHPSDLSLRDIQFIHQEVSELYEQGKRELAAVKQAEYERIEKARQKLRDTMKEWEKLNTGAIRNRKDLGKQYKGVRGAVQRVLDWTYSKTMGAQRFFDWLDGGKKHKGAWVKYFVDDVNKAYDTELRYRFARQFVMEKTMQDLGITNKMLAQARDIDVPHEGNRAWTVDELMSIYAGMKNDKSRDAILYGNFANAGDQAQAWAAKCIEALSESEKALADAIIQEYENHFDRINDALIKIYNQGMEHEKNYTPMRRVEYTSQSKSMLNPDAAESLLTSQSGSGMLSVERGFSKSRKNIGQQTQNGIELGLMSLWYSQVQTQEHAAAFGQLVKDLRKILLGRNEEHSATIRQMVKQTRGQAAWEMIKQYFNIVANDDDRNANDALESVSRYMARNMSIAYLCGNVGTMLKQFGSFSRALPYAGAVNMINAVGQFMQNPKKFLETCYELDPQLRDRKGDAFLRTLQKEDNEIYKQLLKWGSEPIGMMDRAASAITFKAVYDANIKHGLSQNDAVREAQRVVLLTQPAASIKDKPLIWQQHGYAKLLMMFTNDMAQTFGITLYDLTQAIKHGEFPKALAHVTGLTLAAMWIRLLTSGLPDDDDNDLDGWLKWIAGAFAEQEISSIPLIGKEAVTLWDARKGYFRSESPFVAPFAKLMAGSKGLWDDKNDNDERAIFNLIEGGALLAPFPATALKRLWGMGKEFGRGEPGRAAKSMVGISNQDKKLKKASRY